jgi:hypothetical protein
VDALGTTWEAHRISPAGKEISLRSRSIDAPGPQHGLRTLPVWKIIQYVLTRFENFPFQLIRQGLLRFLFRRMLTGFDPF